MAISINQLITQLRRELLMPSDAEDKNLYPFLYVKNIELEVSVNVTQKSGIDGGINIQVLQIGASAEDSDSSIHKITLSLEPLYSKKEVKKILEERNNQHVMDRIQTTTVRGTAKDI
ncbi:MAG: trypco2 family protein [Candidatus Promineifilaceae bacterium]|nr:hypothetical protein [Anaerolineaceae bacterium]